MKQTIKILGISMIGAVVASAAYQKFFVKPAQVQVVEKVVQMPTATSAKMALLQPEAATDFTVAAEKTVDAVVHVTNRAIVQTQPQNIWDFLYGQGGAEYRQAEGTGSGVVISPDGYIITNNHVIEGASEIEITLNNKKKYPAELIGTDKTNDIALVKIDAQDLKYITFADSDTSKVGEWVLAVGNPYNLTSTVTAGIISAKGRDLEGNRNIESFIQTDAAVNPGNSGGALVNTNGELVGINTAISSQTGSFIGYSFAVPSNIAKKIVEDIMEHGSVKKAILGISIDEQPNVEGVIVAEVSANSGAQEAGMKTGDVIKEINDVKIQKFSQLKGHLTAKRPGDIVKVTVDREGITKVFDVKLIEAEALTVAAFNSSFGELTDSEKEKLKVNFGVKVLEVNDKELEKVGIQKGYVILEINNYRVKNTSDMKVLGHRIKKSKEIVRLVVINLEGEKETFTRGW